MTHRMSTLDTWAEWKLLKINFTCLQGGSLRVKNYLKCVTSDLISQMFKEKTAACISQDNGNFY